MALLPEPRVVRATSCFAEPFPNECGDILVENELRRTPLEFERQVDGIVPTLALNKRYTAVLVVELLARAEKIGEVHSNEGNGRRSRFNLLK